MVAVATAQHMPSFAPNGHTYPRPISEILENRFGGSSDSTTTQGPLADRFGNDAQQVNQVQNYPDGRKPFWYLNREAIATQIGINPALAANPASNTAGETSNPNPNPTQTATS